MHEDDIYDDELTHHGVKGMKWGKRKKQYVKQGGPMRRMSQVDTSVRGSIKRHAANLTPTLSNEKSRHREANAYYGRANKQLIKKIKKGKIKTKNDVAKYWDKKDSKFDNGHALMVGLSATGVLASPSMVGKGISAGYAARYGSRINKPAHGTKEYEAYKYKPRLKHSSAMYDDDYLQHYGIMGMRWGKRKSPQQRAAAARNRVRKKQEAQVARQERSDARFEHKQKRIRAKLDTRERAAKVEADEARTRALKNAAKVPEYAEKRARRKEKEDNRRFDKQQKKEAKIRKEEQRVQQQLEKTKAKDRTNTDLKRGDYKHLSDAQLKDVVARKQLETKWMEMNPPPTPALTKFMRIASPMAKPTASMLNNDDMMKGIMGRKLEPKEKAWVDAFAGALDMSGELFKKKKKD